MGFSGLTTQIIMFIAVMGMATGLIAVFQGYVDESSGAMTAQWEVMASNIKTDITISSVSYDNDTNTTTMYVLNTGKTILDIEKIDIYMDGLFMPRDELNRTINVTPSTDSKNTGLWDPKEVLEVRVYKGFDDTDTHIVDISTQYGVKDSETFSV